MNANDADISEERQRELALGDLKQSAQHELPPCASRRRADFATLSRATSRMGRELYVDAYRWLTADEFSWPFSFLNVVAPESRAGNGPRGLMRDLSLARSVLEAATSLGDRAMKTALQSHLSSTLRIVFKFPRSERLANGRAPETLLGYAQMKLRLSFAPLPAQPTTNNNHNTLSICNDKVITSLVGYSIGWRTNQPHSEEGRIMNTRAATPRKLQRYRSVFKPPSILGAGCVTTGTSAGVRSARSWR